MPEPGKYRYLPILPKDERYTTVSLPIQKLGGRDPVTGRVVVRKVGGGNKKKFRWIDTKRHVPEGTVLEEKVFIVRYDPLNSFLIALVANGGHKRWIIASENMKPGDIIRTYNTIPRNAIRGEEGDAWPVGALAPGSLIHNVEMRLGEGGSYIKLAGSCAEIVRRMGDKIVIKGPSKREIAIDERCMAVVGKVSNTEYETINRLCPQRSRWMGDRPASGLWHKKDGYCGRKIRPPKPLLTITSKRPSVDENHIQKFTLLND
jgi:large subunit ribosomal protein L2